MTIPTEPKATSPAMTEGLLSCPFCGGEAEMQSMLREGSDSRWHVIACSQCAAQTAQFEGHSLNYLGRYTPEQAVTAWNTRSLPGGSINDRPH